MSIVAISQTSGSLGDRIGRELAATLSYEGADREIILKAAERFGQRATELEHATEEKPTLWERFAETQHLYRTYVEAIVWELAARDNVVLVGRGAPFVLHSLRHALRVRITAPERLRAERVAQENMLPAELAMHRVRQSDRERAARVKFLYHVDWDDPLLYDLVLNTERLGVKEAARLIQEALQRERFQKTRDSQREVTDLSLTAYARAALLAHGLDLLVTCKDGQLSLRGVVERDELSRVAEEIVGRIPGVVKVLNEVGIVPGRPTVYPA